MYVQITFEALVRLCVFFSSVVCCRSLKYACFNIWAHQCTIMKCFCLVSRWPFWSHRYENASSLPVPASTKFLTVIRASFLFSSGLAWWDDCCQAPADVQTNYRWRHRVSLKDVSVENGHEFLCHCAVCQSLSACLAESCSDEPCCILTAPWIFCWRLWFMVKVLILKGLKRALKVRSSQNTCESDTLGFIKVGSTEETFQGQ